MNIVRRTAKSALRHWHTMLARSPNATKAYLSAMSVFCRAILPNRLAAKVASPLQNFAHEWPSVGFAPRKVVLGDRTSVYLTPHTGEFDQQALFTAHIDYERSVFRWLEQEAATRYDRVIEIGANVGVYSVFLSALCGGRLKDVISFEPSVEAFRRLLANLKANSSKHVLPYMAAVSDRAGFLEFYEPAGHLTNGSFLKPFADVFSNDVLKTTVVAIGPSELEHFFKGKVLLKIDVEGYEPQLLDALGALIVRHEPDLLIEVLPGTPEGISGQAWLTGYEAFIVADDGLEKRENLEADDMHRDWLLTPKALGA